MLGIDVSSWQKDMDLKSIENDFEFIIVKLTEGTTYVNPYATSFIFQAKEMKKCLGVYHFARPHDIDTVKGATLEARAFCEEFEDEYLNRIAIPALDYEVLLNTDRDRIYIRTFLDTVKERLKVEPLLYCPIDILKKFPDLQEYNIWLPRWPSHNIIGTDYTEYVKKYIESSGDYTITVSGIKSIIWQFTDSLVFSNYTNRLDGNYTILTRERWNKIAYGEKIKNEEIISDDMQWAIESGLFKGYGDGTYRPKEALTREQCATVIRRAIELFGGNKNDSK